MDYKDDGCFYCMLGKIKDTFHGDADGEPEELAEEAFRLLEEGKISPGQHDHLMNQIQDLLGLDP